MARHTALFLRTLLFAALSGLMACKSQPHDAAAATTPVEMRIQERTPAAPANVPLLEDDELMAMLKAGAERATADMQRELHRHSRLESKVEEAKRLLKRTALPSNRTGGDNAVLAVWNPDTDKLNVITMVKGKCRTKGCKASVSVANGVNSQYRVESPAGSKVIALKTNVRHPKWRKAVQPVTYVPYSPFMRTDVNVADGRKYLEVLVRRTAERLNRQGVMSLEDPAHMVTVTVPWRVLITLLVIEHVDPADFDRDGVKAVADKVFTLLATNREDTYRYAVSYANARGLAQFIEPTYQFTRERYPKAKLPKSFVDGMTDHEHAVSAQYCLADWSLTKLLPPHKERLTLPENEEELGAFLAASYNGGEDRAAAALTANPEGWKTMLRPAGITNVAKKKRWAKKKETRAHWEAQDLGLFPQTVKYVQIFHATYQHLFPKP